MDSGTILAETYYNTKIILILWKKAILALIEKKHLLSIL